MLLLPYCMAEVSGQQGWTWRAAASESLVLGRGLEDPQASHLACLAMLRATLAAVEAVEAEHGVPEVEVVGVGEEEAPALATLAEAEDLQAMVAWP